MRRRYGYRTWLGIAFLVVAVARLLWGNGIFG